MDSESQATPLPNESCTEAEIVRVVITIIRECLELDDALIDADTEIYNELGCDSLGAVDIMVELKKHYGIQPPTDESLFIELCTPRKLAGYVLQQKADKKCSARPSDD